jgi:bifunctional isochorismate lyase / aryl carrier protein
MPIAPIGSYELPSEGSWPRCRAPWAFEPARAALLVHDMQAYFLEPYESAAPPLGPLLENVEALRVACDANDVPVIFSAQPGEQSRAERGLLWDLWGPGIVERPALQELGLRPAPNDVLIAKRRYSAFHDTGLAELLADKGRDQLLITGVYAHIGCLATALDGFMRGIQSFVVADATADFSQEDHLMALRQVARTCGVVATTKSALLDLNVAFLRRTLATRFGIAAPLPLDDDLGDHGLDSVRAMELLGWLLPAEHGRDFADIVEARSLRALSKLMLPAMLAEPS